MGEAELLVASAESLRPYDWSPDGNHLLLGQLSPRADLFVYSIAEPREIESLTKSEAREYSARFSPDGRWIAYTSTETGEPQVYVRPFPGPGPRVPISTEVGRNALFWSPDGDELFYMPDGESFITVRYPETVETGRIDVVLDLRPELKRLLPGL